MRLMVWKSFGQHSMLVTPGIRSSMARVLIAAPAGVFSIRTRSWIIVSDWRRSGQGGSISGCLCSLLKKCLQSTGRSFSFEPVMGQTRIFFSSSEIRLSTGC